MDTKTFQTIKILITTPEATLFDGTAKSVTSANADGPFDVLPLHENFISIIQKDLVVQVSDKEKKSFPLDTGVMKVSENEIEIYLGIQTLVS